MVRACFRLHKLFFLTVLLLLALPFFAGAASKKSEESSEKEKTTSTISIENARQTEYKKDPVSGDDCIVLTGDVRISVTSGSTKTVIKADKVNYNRVNDMLYAEGSVSLESSGSSAGGESVTASSLIFNTITLEGVFDNGRVVQTKSDALNLPSGSTLNVASNIFGRDSSNTIAFKSGELTFCDDESPHWRIKASRIWLLPGGEFAFLNAFLYVGRVPLLYLPAFYYPKDELIFNPAFGYRYREGWFINTTTYLYGRKPLTATSTADLNSDDDDEDDKINFFSLMKTSSLKEQEREGLVLHNLDEDYTGDTTNYAKIMADWYSNLGAMVGLDGVYKPGGYITDIEGTVMLGFSNTIFKSDGVYLPYAASGEVYQDSSHFLSFDFPFRFYTNLKFVLSKPFSLTLSMPMYSDPYVSYDFNTRAETMDWIDFLMSNPGSDDEDETVTEVSSFTWTLNGSYSIPLPTVLNPYISTLSISSLSSSLIFSSKTNSDIDSTDSLSTYSPERKFYYPSQITPFKTTVKLAGTLVKYPATAKKSTSSKSSVSLTSPDEFLTEEELAKKAEEKAKKEAEKAAKESGQTTPPSAPEEKSDPEKESKEDDVLFTDAALPLLNTSVSGTQSISGISYALTYNVTADYTSQFTYSSSALSTPEDFVWSNIDMTYYQVKAPTTLKSVLGWRDSFISLTDTFTFNPVYQEHPSFSDNYTETQINSYKKTDYSAKKLDLTDVNALSLKPFYYTEHFANTALTWNTTIKMIRTEYISDDVENPEWEYLTTELWNDECVTVHNLNLVLAASEFDDAFSQQLSLTTTLPPQVDSYKGVLTFKFPYVSLSGGTGIHRTSSTDDTWVKDDISQSLAISLFNSKLKFTQSYIYDQEEEEHQSFKLALSGYGVQLAYTASYTTGYSWDKGLLEDDSSDDKGWVADSEKSFQPYSLSLAYASGTKTWKHWSDRITFSPSVSSSIVYDYLRPTNSYFTFIPSITFKINDFLDVKFSAESRNSVIYRYFADALDLDIPYQGETNVLTDLLNSFDFSDETKRKQTGFKMKKISATITHDLDDWDLSASFSISPRLVTSSSDDFSATRNNGNSYYDFSPYFTISVAWRPMEGMKTEIVDEYGEWQLNP